MNSVWIVNSRYRNLGNIILTVEHVASSKEKALEFINSASGKEVMNDEKNEFIHWLIYEADIDNELFIKNSFNIFGTKDGVFMDMAINEEIETDSVDEYIEKWHKGDGKDKSPAEYLGMADKEYAYFVENKNGYVIEDIIEARKTNSPLINFG